MFADAVRSNFEGIGLCCERKTRVTGPLDKKGCSDTGDNDAGARSARNACGAGQLRDRLLSWLSDEDDTLDKLQRILNGGNNAEMQAFDLEDGSQRTDTAHGG